MLGVSLKLSENIDIVQPLNRYIASHYTENETKTVAKSISDINLTRQRLVQFLQRNENDHIQALDFFTNYYKSLLVLEQHFPFGKESQSSILGIKTGKVPTVKIPFTWFGSFRHSKKTMEYDLALEKSAILFNIGALYSRQATKVKSGATAKDDSGLKEACGYFTQASGVFEMMASTPEITAAGQWDPDLTVEALQMLARLMLAQAQACFFEKATTSASPKLVAKLAAGVSELFRQTHALCESPRLKQFFTSDMYPWDAHLQYQIYCYQAAAFYWQAKQLLSEDEYGAEIAHLEKAKRVVESAKRFEGQLLKTLADNRQKLEANIVARLNAANKDNETIYFVQIPKPDTVRDIEGIINVKVVPFNVTPGEDHFTSLVPPQVREGAQAFQTQLRDALSNASKHATESTNYAKMHLSSLNLPAALEAMEPAKGIPQDVWTQVEDAKYKGGPAALATLNDNIASATTDAEQQHQHIVDTLAKESADDRAMRTQFAHKWNRKPSEQITVQFQRDVDAIAGYLRDAAASNNKVRTDWSSNLDQLEILTLTREQVEAQLPQEQGHGEEKTEASENLRRLLDQLSHLLSERDRIIAQQTSTIESYSIIPTLISQRSRPQETIFAEELAKLDVKAQLDPLEKQQEELLAQITIASEHFEKTRAKNDTALARQRVIQSLNVAAQIFNRLLANFSEGLKFYSELIATKIVPLKQRVDDFIIARDLEKRMILEQLTKDAAGYQEEKHDVRPASAISGAIPYPTMPAPAPTVATNPNNILDDKNTHPQYVFTAPPAHNPEVVTHEMNKMSVSPQPVQQQPTPTPQPMYSPPPVQSPPPQQPAYQAPVYQPPPQAAIQHPTYTPPVQPQVQHQQPQQQQHQQQQQHHQPPQQPQQHHVPPPSYQQWQQPQPQSQHQPQPQPQAQPQYQVPQYQAPAYQQPAYQPQQAHPQPAFQPNPFQHYPPPQQQQQQQQQQHPQYQPYQAPQAVPQYQPPPTQQQPQQASGKWNCKACTFENSGTGPKCSMCDTFRDSHSA